jgi:hypothetical protein
VQPELFAPIHVRAAVAPRLRVVDHGGAEDVLEIAVQPLDATHAPVAGMDSGFDDADLDDDLDDEGEADVGADDQ